MPAAVAYGSLPFKQQIAFFRNKQNVVTEHWADLWEAEHDNAFMVAGANRIDLVADFREATRAAIEDDETLEQFRARFDSIVAKYGWDYNGGRNWRSRIIYETNLRSSYSAGRYQQQLALARTLPFWRYKHSDAVQHPRPVHQGWNNKIWRADDPVWKVIYPPNGWGCQCYVEALSEADMGGRAPDPSPQLKWVDAEIGQRSPSGPRTVRTVEGVDPGFAYAPGASLDTWPSGSGTTTPPAMQRTLEQSTQNVLRKSLRLPAADGASMLGKVLDLPRAQDAIEAGYAEFQAGVVASGQSQNASYIVGALDSDLVESLASRGLQPVTAPIVARDVEVQHALRTSKTTNRSGIPISLTAAELSHLPSLLRTARAVLLDPTDNSLLYVVDASTRRDAAKVVIRVNYRLKMEDGRDVVNSFRTATLVSLADLDAEVRGGAVQLLRGALK